MYDDKEQYENSYDKQTEKKKKVKRICISILVGVLTFNTLTVVQLYEEVKSLRSEIVSQQSNLYNRVNDVQRAVYNQTSEIRDLLEEQEALFETTDVQVRWQGKQLAVNVHAIPKALHNNETLWVSIAAGDDTYTQQLDANGKGTVRLEPTVASFVPTLQIKSPTGVQQQVLEQVATAEYLSANVDAMWTGKYLDFYISPRDTELPFTADEIADIYLVVSDTGERSTDAIPEAPVTIPVDGTYNGYMENYLKGDRVEVTRMSDDTQKALYYRADVSEYLNRKDNTEYVMNLVVETTYGLTYATVEYEPLASYHDSGKTSHFSANTPLLAPIFGINE